MSLPHPTGVVLFAHGSRDPLWHRPIEAVAMFLGVGRHAREDLPALVHNLRVQYHLVPILLQDAVGEDPRMVQLLAQIALDSA